MYELEVRRKIVAEYVQHVYELKLEHQKELDKGKLKICLLLLNTILWFILVEEIYEQKLLGIRTYSGRDIETIVKGVREEADAAIADLRK